MRFVEELLLERQEMNRVLLEEEDLRVDCAESLRDAAEAEMCLLLDARGRKELAQVTAAQEARDALTLAQQLRDTVEGLKRDGWGQAQRSVIVLRDELERAARRRWPKCRWQRRWRRRARALRARRLQRCVPQQWQARRSSVRVRWQRRALAPETMAALLQARSLARAKA